MKWNVAFGMNIYAMIYIYRRRTVVLDSQGSTAHLLGTSITETHKAAEHKAACWGVASFWSLPYIHVGNHYLHCILIKSNNLCIVRRFLS